MNDELKRFTAMPEVYCALQSKSFLNGEFANMTSSQQEAFLEQKHRIHTYQKDMENIQNKDIFRQNFSM